MTTKLNINREVLIRIMLRRFFDEHPTKNSL
jgi:hypothetical protein